MQCPSTAFQCTDPSTLDCHNGGKCCETTTPAEKFCACPAGYSGPGCIIDNEFYADLMYSRDETIKMIGLSSVISIVVGIIALLALGVIALVIVRNLRKRRPWGLLEKEPDLDATIIYVQDEISKLSTVQQLNKLHRLSKLFEKTVREAILSDPGHSADRPKSVAMNDDHLPRWSSAPACINRPPNELDTVDAGDDVFVDKPKYETLFSHQAPMQKTHRFTSHL